MSNKQIMAILIIGFIGVQLWQYSLPNQTIVTYYTLQLKGNPLNKGDVFTIGDETFIVVSELCGIEECQYEVTRI